jgi:glycosyltransferase involved in cell wall biosynthesis
MIIFLISNNLHPGIIESQVNKIAFYSSQKMEKKIYIYMTRKNFDKSEYRFENKDVEYIFFNSISEIKKDFKKAHTVYYRSPFFLWMVLIAKIFYNKKLKIIFDFRGLTFVESWYRNKNFVKSLVIFLLEFIAYATADEVCAVSYSLADKIKKWFYKRNVNVIPCGVEKVYLRKKTWNDDIHPINFVYSGSIQRWQQFEETLEIFVKIEKIIPATLSIFTPNVEAAKDILMNSKIQIKELKALPQSEVCNRLQEFDFGFIIRENNLVNKVSCPVKCLEYLSTGVLPFITPYVGDLSDDIIKHDIGYVHSSDKINFQKILDLLKDTNIKYRMADYVSNFTWENILHRHPLRFI